MSSRDEFGKEKAEPDARANGPKRPWLILNVEQRKMILRSLLFLPVLAFAGCAHPKRVDMGARFFTRPVELLIVVTHAEAKFDSTPLRYAVEVVVEAPAGKKGAVVHLVVDGISSGWQPFVVPGSKWWISADELIFDEEARFHLSFLTVDQMKPRKAEEPNQALEPTAPSGRGSS